MPQRAPLPRIIIPAILVALFAALLLRADDVAELTGLQGNAPAVDALVKITEALLWISAAWLIGRAVAMLIAARRKHEPVSGEGTKLLGDVIMIAAVSAGAIGALAFVFGRPVTGLVATSGFLAAIVGFAVRDMIADLFSGIALNVEKPFSIGDWIEIESGEQGEIIEMNWRATRLVTIQGRMVVVPNSALAGGKFINLYRPKRAFRTVMRLVVDYQAPPQRVIDIFQSAMESTNGVLRGYPNVVLIDHTTERGIEYGMHFWVDHAVKRYLIERQVVVNAIEFLNQAGLVPAYPKVDVSVAKAQLRHIERSADMQDLLDRIDLLQALPPTAIEDLAGRVRSKEFQAGSTIVERGDEGGSLFVLVSGLADVYVNGADSGQERRIASLHPGQVFGEMSLLTGARRSATVRAATTLIAVEVGKADLQPIMDANPQLVDRLSEMQSTRLSENAEELALSAKEQAELSEVGLRRLLQRRIRQFFNLSDRTHDAT